MFDLVVKMSKYNGPSIIEDPGDFSIGKLFEI